MAAADDDAVPFVLRGRFGVPGHEVFALMVLAIYDFARYRVAVLMDICRAHKDGYLQTALLEVFRVRSLFDNHDLPVCGSDDKTVACRQFTRGYAKERDQEQLGSQGDQKDQPAEPGRVCADEIKGDQIDDGKSNGTDSNGLITFSMDRHYGCLFCAVSDGLEL